MKLWIFWAGHVSTIAAGRREQRAEHRDADEHQRRRDADHDRGLVALAAAEQPVPERADARAP